MLCYIHVPKCGGTTFRSILDSQFDLTEICPAGTPGDFKALSDEDLARYRLLRGHFGYNIRERLPREPVFVTMLRDPVDRVVSMYHFWRESPVNPNARAKTGEQAAKELSFKDFLRSDIRRVVWWTENTHVYQIADTVHTKKRKKPDRWKLDVAKEHLESFAFFGLSEHFDDSVALLTDTFGWPPQGGAPNLNVTAGGRDERELDDETRALIEARVGLDIELYDFARELFERRLAAMRERHAERPPEIHARWPRALPAEGLDLGFDEAVHGLNWHIREGVERGRPWRWTGPGRRTTLDLTPEVDGAWAVQLGIVDAVAPEVAEGVEAVVGGQALAVHDSRIEGGRGVRAWLLPAEMAPAGETLRLEFVVPETRRLDLQDDDLRDTRTVGIAVDRITVSPIDDGSAARGDSASRSAESPTIAAFWSRLAAAVRQGRLLTAVGRRLWPPFGR